MKIGMNNYYQEVNQVGLDKFTPGLKKMHEVIDKLTKGGEDWSAYGMYKDRFEKQFEALELFKDELEMKANETTKPLIELQTPFKTPLKTGTQQKPIVPNRKYQGAKAGNNDGGGRNSNKEVNKNKKLKQFIKPNVKGKGVELVSPEISFIKRYALLHNKTKNKEQVAAFLRSLQKAIVERRIRKTSKHAKTIIEIQKQLIAAYKKMGNELRFVFDHKDLTRYYKITGAEIVLPSIRFIKAFVALQGKEVTKHKLSNLYSRIVKSIHSKVIKPSDKYFKEIRLIENTLKEFLNTNGNTVSISERQLNGLQGALKECGCNELNGLENYQNQIEEEKIEEQEIELTEELPEQKNHGVMSVIEARQKVFRPVELTGEWLRLIGKMCLPTHFLIYGLGGSGKSSFVLLFCQFLSRLGYRILYVASEQYDTPTFTEILNRLNIVAGENFQIVKDLNVLNPKDFDFVVLDSKDDMDIQLAHFKALKRQYPNQSFITISQGTKSGDFTGKGQWRNAVDVMIHAENGNVKTGTDKNRWGGAAELKILP